MPAGVTVVRRRVVSSTLQITMPVGDSGSSDLVDASWAWRNVAAIVAALAQHHSVQEAQIFIDHVSNVGSRRPVRRLNVVPNAGIDITYFVKIMSGDDTAHIKDAAARFNNPDNFAGFLFLLAKVMTELGASRLPQNLRSARGRAEAAVVLDDYLVPKATWIPISDWGECSREGWQSRQIECSTGNPKACDLAGRIPKRRPCNGSLSSTTAYRGVVIVLVAWALVILAWIFRCWWEVPKLTSGSIQLTSETGEEQRIRLNVKHDSNLRRSRWMARMMRLLSPRVLCEDKRPSLSHFSHGQRFDDIAESVCHDRLGEARRDDMHVLSNRGKQEEEDLWSPDDVVVHIVDHARESQNGQDLWSPDDEENDDLWSPDEESLWSPDDESVSDAATKNYKEVDVLSSDIAREAYSSAHELEYFSTTYCHWVTASVVSSGCQHALRRTPRYDILIGRHPGFQGQRQTLVELNCLREPLTGPVSYYCSEQLSWLPAEAAPEAVSQATQTMPSYWVQLLDPPSVIRHVPAVQVRARFYCGCQIEAYLGLDTGWVPGVVLASSPLDEGPLIDQDITITPCCDALSPRLARPAWLRGLEDQKIMTQLWCNVTVEIEVSTTTEFAPQREETSSTFCDQVLEVVTLPSYRLRHSELTV